MKLTVNKDGAEVVLTSQNSEEAILLFQFRMFHEENFKAEIKDIFKQEVEQPKKRRKKHPKTCEICGKSCVGLAGLGIHKSHVHGIRGSKADEYDASKAEKAKQAQNIENNNFFG